MHRRGHPCAAAAACLTAGAVATLAAFAAPAGAQLGLAVAPGVKLVGNVAHAAGNLQVGIPFLGGINAGTTSALMMDAGIRIGF